VSKRIAEPTEQEQAGVLVDALLDGGFAGKLDPRCGEPCVTGLGRPPPGRLLAGSACL